MPTLKNCNDFFMRFKFKIPGLNLKGLKTPEWFYGGNPVKVNYIQMKGYNSSFPIQIYFQAQKGISSLVVIGAISC
jgi:hypothetical protein